jgi:hypothetical protein
MSSKVLFRTAESAKGAVGRRRQHSIAFIER